MSTIINIYHITRGYGIHQIEAKPVETVILNLCRNLYKLGYNVIILDSGKHDEKKILDGISIVLLAMPELPLLEVLIMKLKKIRFIRFIFEELNFVIFGYKVAKYFKKIGINHVDIIHVHSTLVGIAILVFNHKIASKMVYTSHVNIWSLNSKSFLEKCTLLLDIILMRWTKKVIALNSFLKDKYILIGRIPSYKIDIVNNGVDNLQFKNVDISLIKNKYKLKGFNVLFVGRFDKIKGIKYLLNAAKIIINDWNYRDILFILVGTSNTTNVNKSENINDLHIWMKKHNLESNVILTGYLTINELQGLYLTCDVVVVPSLAEADPLVPLEAMAAGKPVIGSKVGGIQNQIVEKHNGFSIEPANEYQIADKIYFLLKNGDLLKILGENSRNRVEKYFTWEKVSEDLSVIYSKMG